MGTICFSKKTVIDRGEHLVMEPDAVGAVAYRCPLEFSNYDNEGTVGDAVERVEQAFMAYCMKRTLDAATKGSVIGHKLIRVRIWDPSLEWVEFEYAT